MKIKNILISLLVITSMLMSNVYAIDNSENIYVSATGGSDSGDGTYRSPLKTIKAAKDKVAEIKGANKGVTVNIMAGTYNISDLRFDADDSGTSNAKIVWKAYNNDEVILTSEQKIDNTRIISANAGVIRKIPLEARKNIKQIELTDEEISAIGSIRYTGQRHSNNDAPAYLAQNGKMLEIAGYPNKVNMTIPNNKLEVTNVGFRYTIDDERISRWSTAKDAYLVGNPTYEWYEDTLSIADITGSKITTAECGSYHIRYGAGAQLRIVNLVEEIDYPGEFYIDREEGYLYFYPLDEVEGSSFALVTSQKPLITFDGAQHISFENLIFEGTCSTGIIINSSDNITLKNCEMRNIGKNVVEIIDSKNTIIEGSHIHDIGKHGITISGGDYSNLTPNNNVITNCHIEKYGQILGRSSNAISAYGLGDKISHNRIHAADHSAIMFGGNNNIIEYNDIYDVLNSADDAGAIYAGRSWVDGGTEIRYNYIHDNPYSNASGNGRSGVYLDDSFAGTKIYGNVFANMNAGVKLHGSQYNDIQNNVFINLKSSVRLGNLNGDTDAKIRWTSEEINGLLKEGEAKFKSSSGYASLSENKYRGAHTLYGRYFEKFDPYNVETDEYKLWNEKFPYLKNYIDSTGKHMTPKGNVIKNNATYTGGETQVGSAAICLVDYEDNTWDIGDNNEEQDNFLDEKTTSVDVNTINMSSYGAVKIADTGIEGETSLTLNDFGVVYPENQAYVDTDRLVLIWDEDSGAQEYHIVISKNEDLSSPIVDEIVENAYFELKDATLETDYYWTVEAKINHHLYSSKTKQIKDGIMRFSTRDLSNVRSLIATANDDTGIVSITASTSVVAGQPVAVGMWKDEYVEKNTMNGQNAICIDQIKVVTENGKNVINYDYQLPIDALSGKYHVRVRVFHDDEVVTTSFLYTNNNRKKQAKVIIINKTKTVKEILDDHLIDIDVDKGIQYQSFDEEEEKYLVTKLTGYTNYDDFINRLDDAYYCISLLDSFKTSFDSTAQATLISNDEKFGLTSDSLAVYNSLSEGLKDYAMLNFRETIGNAVTPADIPALFAAAVATAKNNEGPEGSSDPSNSPTGPSGSGSSGVGNNITGGMSFGGGTLDPSADSGAAFTDLGSVEWAKTAIETLAEKNIINGKGNQKFAPLDKVTREEFLKMILVAFDIETEPADLSFADVDKNAWYYPYVAKAVSYGIINGISDTEFGTGKNITRQDAAVIISRVVEKDDTVKLYSVDPNFKFNDINNVSEYAATAVETLGKAKIINGKENDMFDPFGQATRAEAAMIIYNLLFK